MYIRFYPVKIDGLVISLESRLCERSEAISQFATDWQKRDCRPCLNHAGAGVAEFTPHSDAGLLAMTARETFYECIKIKSCCVLFGSADQRI